MPWCKCLICTYFEKRGRQVEEQEYKQHNDLTVERKTNVALNLWSHLQMPMKQMPIAPFNIQQPSDTPKASLDDLNKMMVELQQCSLIF